MLVPVKKANERVVIAKGDSDITLFLNLMYAGEQLLKLVTCGMVTGIKDSFGNKDNDKYAQNFRLVHADSIGPWAQVLTHIVSGPAYTFLEDEFRVVWEELNEKVSNPSWQYGALVALNNCIKILNEKFDDTPTKTQLKNWFPLFVQLRNDARAHGVINAEEANRICPNLETSIKLISENLTLFKIPWIFIKRNISGSFRLSALNEIDNLEKIKECILGENLEDGVYIYNKKPFRVDLLESTVEAIDFYFPNGNFNDRSYECISYISGKKIYKESSKYLRPPGQLPQSETHGKTNLDLINSTFTNLPHLQTIYINRKELEEELESSLLIEDKYPIITLSGRGGIGKTSLALHILHKICNTDRYAAIVWLSARDIDLLDDGPKIVKPQILDEFDISVEFTSLLEPHGYKSKGFNPRQFVERELREIGPQSVGRVLLVMDNFETLRNPLQVFKWIDTHVRNPNKVLITSRLRDFKADYPITVKGMNREEFDELVERVAIKLNIQPILNKKFLDELYKESDGHPYVVKVMLGEVSMQRELKNVKRVIAGKDEILTALFERTYSSLHPSSKKIFLTLSSWRNIFPEIAIEAVLNREENELINIEEAIEELSRYSFIEIIKSNLDESVFISVPISAFEFGRKKLNVSPLKSKIQLDIEILNYFGVTQFTDINKGLKPKIDQFFKSIAAIVHKRKEILVRYLPILEFLCRIFPQGWEMFANLYYEINDIPKAIESIQNFVADHRPSVEAKMSAWEFLSKLYSAMDDHIGEAHALVEMCKIENIDFNDLCNAVNTLMNLFKTKKSKFQKEELFILLQGVAEKMHDRINMGEGGVREFTELAWVYIALGKKAIAKKLVVKALKRDENHYHALNLAKILNMNPESYSP